MNFNAVGKLYDTDRRGNKNMNATQSLSTIVAGVSDEDVKKVLEAEARIQQAQREARAAQTPQAAQVPAQNQSSAAPAPVPLPPGTGSKTILKIEKLLRRFVHFKDPDISLLLAVWIAATFAFRCFEYCGYVCITSATKRCGKTLLLDLLRHLCADATQRLSNVTEAVMFYLAGQGHTLIFDEVESLAASNGSTHGAIMDVLCNGFQRGGTVVRMEKTKSTAGESYAPREHNVYSPKAFAGINEVKDTIEDRSFKIVMQRKPPGQKTERFRSAKLEPTFKKLRDRLRAWTAMQGGLLENTDTALLDRLEPLAAADDRFKDISEPLYMIAWAADMELIESRIAGALPQPDDKLLRAFGFEPLSGEEQRTIELAKAARAGELILPRLAAVLGRMAAARNDSESPEPISGWIPMLEDRLQQSGQGRAFVPTADLRDAKGADGITPIWGQGPRVLAAYLQKLGLKGPTKSPKGERGYWVDRAWVEQQRGAYGAALPPPGTGAGLPLEASNVSNVSSAQQNQQLT
jgi:hypothetical protein